MMETHWGLDEALDVQGNLFTEILVPGQSLNINYAPLYEFHYKLSNR